MLVCSRHGGHLDSAEALVAIAGSLPADRRLNTTLGRRSGDISPSWSIPRFFLNICQGEFAYPRLVAAHENIDAVRQEARTIFADLARDIVTSTTNPNWQMEVREDTGKLVYRIKLAVDSPE